MYAVPTRLQFAFLLAFVDFERLCIYRSICMLVVLSFSAALFVTLPFTPLLFINHLLQIICLCCYEMLTAV